jgi:hypothetical protein
MLFDLKGRRKRFIQATYLVLAVLFGGGLILFGVGSNVQGGLLDAISGNGSGSVDTSTFDKEAARAQRAVQADPKNERAWLALARAEYNKATAGPDFNRKVGQFETGASDELKRAVRAWEHYLALHPKKPDAGAAALMVQAYAGLVGLGAGGTPLDLFQRAAQTQRVIAETRPSPIAYFQLSGIWFAIGEVEKGDRAGAKAVALTPKDQRNTVTAQLKDARKDGLKTKRELKKAEDRAAKAAKDARKSGQDPFGTQPGQSPLGAQAP